jgi:hypothetical protein
MAGVIAGLFRRHGNIPRNGLPTSNLINGNHPHADIEGYYLSAEFHAEQAAMAPANAPEQLLPWPAVQPRQRLAVRMGWAAIDSGVTFQRKSKSFASAG